MRLQLRSSQYVNKCACAVTNIVGRIKEAEQDYRLSQNRDNEWPVLQQLYEAVPDDLRKVDSECSTKVSTLYRGVHEALRRRDFKALTNADAAIFLELCGENREIVFTPDELLAAQRRTTEENIRAGQMR